MNRLQFWTASKILTMVLALSLLTSTSFSQAPTKVTEVEGITEYRLDNGIKLLLSPDPSKPQFTVNVTFLVGSRHEGYGETGMAHLLEHMLFRGTDLHPDIPGALKERGVMNMNGTTSYDRTNYFETLPAGKDNLEFALRMEADRMINSWIKPEHFEKEMTVVRNEFERGENNAMRILFQRTMASAYEWHNYGKTTIGNRTDIERVQIPNLRTFYRKYYQPDNVVLVLSGKFDVDEALQLVEKHFGAIPRPKRELPKTYTVEPPQDGERTVVLRRNGDTKLVSVGYHIPAASDELYPAAQVLSKILGMEPAGPLYKSMVETKIASSVSTMNVAGHDPGMMIAMAEVPEEADVFKARDELLKQIEQIGETGVDSENVKRAVQQILRRRERQFANSEQFSIALSEWEAYGDWRLYFLHRDRLEKVTAEDVKKVAKRFCVSSNRTVGMFLPTKDPLRAFVDERPNVTKVLAGYKGRKKIVQGEAFEPTPENIDARTITGELDFGLKYALLPKKTRDERVFLQATIHYGNEDNLKGFEVASGMLSQLLKRGTTELDHQEYRDRLNEISTTLNFSGMVGTLGVNMQTKRKHLKEALQLMKQALRTPELSEKDFDVVKRMTLTQLNATRSDPRSRAVSAFQQLSTPFPRDDVRYFPTIEEQIERTENVTIEKVRQLHSEYLNGVHVQFAIVGDFDTDGIEEQLTDVFGDWEPKAEYARLVKKPNMDLTAERIEILTPDKKNAVYIAGLSMPVRDDDPDYEALLLGNYILGGGPLSSRLADRVRKQEGLSYGVGSQLQIDYLDEAGVFLVFAISNPENTPKVVDAIDDEVTRLLESGVRKKELETAKAGYLKTRRGRRANERLLAAMLARNLETGRSMKFNQESDEAIERLDKDAVDAALRKFIDKKRLVIVTAGDFKKSEDDKE